MRADKSAARPIAVVYRGAARINGILSPWPWAGSIAEAMDSSRVGSSGAVRKGASGWPMRRLRGVE
jgi:hypothetical protein